MIYRYNAPPVAVSPHRQTGFTLIELLVVMTLMGVMSGVAAPNVWAFFTKTMEQKDLDTFAETLEALRLQAWETGRSVQLPKDDQKKWPALPEGWQAQTLPAIRFLATGITNGGQIVLTSPASQPWQIDIRPLDGRISFARLSIPVAHE